jgi:Uma2 family endonuclease
MSDATRLVTAEELEKFPDDDYRYELVEGRVIRMSPVGFQHGRIVMDFGAKLNIHARTHNLGAVLTEVGFTLRSSPDTVRAPDIAFIKQDRIPSVDPRGFWKGPPDLAVEVLSPDDRPMEVRTKVAEYLTYSVPLVVVLDPDRKTVSVFRHGVQPVTLGSDDELDLDEVVRGFRCRVREIFE